MRPASLLGVFGVTTVAWGIEILEPRILTRPADSCLGRDGLSENSVRDT